MAKFSVCRIYKVTLWLNFSYNYSVNLLQILHLYIFLGDFIIRMSHDNDVTIILAFNRISAFICVFSGNPLLYIYFEVLAFWFATFHKNL